MNIKDQLFKSAIRELVKTRREVRVLRVLLVEKGLITEQEFTLALNAADAAWKKYVRSQSEGSPAQEMEHLLRD